MADIDVRSFDGSSFGAFLARPTGDNGPGLLLIHDIFGLNQSMRALVETIASWGYIVLCPDLFARQQTGGNELSEDDWEQAALQYKNFDAEAGVRDLLAALAHMRQLSGCSGKIAALGHGLGGKLAFLLATRSDVDCIVGYDNVGIDALLGEIYDIRAPLLLHFGAQDPFMPEPVRLKLLKALSRNASVSCHLYPAAGHAFARPKSAHYHPENAALAEERTKTFLAEHVQT